MLYTYHVWINKLCNYIVILMRRISRYLNETKKCCPQLHPIYRDKQTKMLIRQIQYLQLAWLQVVWLWEETRIPGRNLHTHGENMQATVPPQFIFLSISISCAIIFYNTGTNSSQGFCHSLHTLFHQLQRCASSASINFTRNGELDSVA